MPPYSHGMQPFVHTLSSLGKKSTNFTPIHFYLLIRRVSDNRRGIRYLRRSKSVQKICEKYSTNDELPVQSVPVVDVEGFRHHNVRAAMCDTKDDRRDAGL